MFKKFMENRIVCREAVYKCYICHHEIEKNAVALENHIETRKHQEKLNEIDKSLRAHESEKLDTISEKKRRLIVHNQITYDSRKPNCLYCHICKCSISGISNTLEHIKGAWHTKTLSDSKNSDKENTTILTASSKNQETVVQKTNQVIPAKLNNLSKIDCMTYDVKKNLHKCNVCNCEIPGGSNNILLHIQGSLHRKIAAYKDCKTINTFFNESINDKSSTLTKLNNDFIEIRFCTPCQIHLKNTTMLQFHNLVHLHKEINIPHSVDIVKYSFKKEQPILKCLLCNTFISYDENVYKHFKSPLHLDRLEFFRYIKDDIELGDTDYQQIDKQDLEKLNFKPPRHIIKAFLCRLCDVPVTKLSDRNSHVIGKKHQINALQGLKILNNSKSIEDIPNFYACYICEKSFFNAANLIDHYRDRNHKLKIKCFDLIYKNLYVSFVVLNGQSLAKCRLCENYLMNCRAAIEHILGKKHNLNLTENAQNSSSDNSQSIDNNEIVTLKAKIVPVKTSTSKLSNIKKKNEFETSTEELLKLGFSVENLHSATSIETDSLDVDDILNDLVPLALTNSQQKRLMRTSRLRKPRVANFESKKNSQFNKNVYLWGKSLIKYCISSGVENIYNINSEKFRLLKLGTSLIFPWESEYACSVCAEQLADQQVLFEHLQDDKHLENLQKMEENDKEFEDYDDQFSDLELAYNYMQEESDDWIHCYACNSKVKNDDTYIHLHIKESNHVNTSQLWKNLSNEICKKISTIFSEVWYYAQVFICDVCKTKNDMEIDFIMHLETQKHKENVGKLLQKGTLVKFGVCPVCITYWYGTADFYNMHCKDQIHKRVAKNGDFMVPNMTVTALELLNNVDEKVEFLINESNKAVLEKYKETELLKAIEEAVESIYPNAKAYTFGSRLSELGFIDSDVDVFLDCDNLYYSGTTQEQSQQYVTSVKKNFDMLPDIWIIDEVLLVTRVPILKLRHIPTGLKCDISFINGLSVEKSKLIGFYNAAYPTCRELILYLKRWLSLCRITGSDSITTFAISWYVIFYLQVKGVLPSVYDLIQLKNESKIIDGWECGFQDNFSANYSDSNFRQHLKGFFSYYAKFNYKTDVACPYLGKVIKKHTFAYENQLPTEMQIYRHRLQEDYSRIFRYDSPMCIQDPIDLSQNITKAVKKCHLRCFRQYCTESAEKC